MARKLKGTHSKEGGGHQKETIYYVNLNSFAPVLAIIR